jgi:uncharacterized protein (DUF4415 family)
LAAVVEEYESEFLEEWEKRHGNNEKPLQFAEGVAPAPDTAESDSAFFEAMAKPGKIRITTMVDEDVYKELRRRASEEGDGRYQTLLNEVLRAALFGQQERDVITEIAADVKILLSAFKPKKSKTKDRDEPVRFYTPKGVVVTGREAVAAATATMKKKSAKKRTHGRA